VKWSPTGFVKPGAVNSGSVIPASVTHAVSLFADLTAKASKTTRALLGDAEGELALMRLRTKTSEYIVAPSAEVSLVVIQKAHAAPLVPLVVAAEAAQMAAAAEDKAKGKGGK
jgi:hypothetical protein